MAIEVQIFEIPEEVAVKLFEAQQARQEMEELLRKVQAERYPTAVALRQEQVKAKTMMESKIFPQIK